MKPVFSGAALAAAAATLVISGMTLPTSVQAEEAKGQCIGANSCKGQSACKTAKNECKGRNACKGQGFMELTKAECDKIEGAKFMPVKG